MSKKQPNQGVPAGYVLVSDAPKKGGKVPVDRGPSDLTFKVVKKKLPVWDIPKKES